MHPEACRYLLRFMFLTCRPSGTPKSKLHIILHCPTLSSGSYTSLDSGPLDRKNQTTKFLIDKGFRDSWSFTFDVFPRRIFIPESSRTRDARTIYPWFTENHDALHESFRQHGGEITLVMGLNAQEVHKKICKNANRKLRVLFERDGWNVWAEMVSTNNFLVPRVLLTVSGSGEPIYPSNRNLCPASVLFDTPKFLTR